MNEPTPDASITRILQAESDARDSVERCRRDAEGLLEEATQGARRIADRADERVGTLHARMARALARRIARMRTQAAALEEPGTVSAQDRERLRRAVSALASELTKDDL